MNVGIIGFGSMGRMLSEKFSTLCGTENAENAKNVEIEKLYITNRSREKLADVGNVPLVCNSNCELAALCDIVFVCTRPVDIKNVVEEISSSLKEKTLLVSLNGSVTFDQLEKIINHKMAKVIPSVTAEINRSQTLVCYNSLATNKDKQQLEAILSCMGNVIELPENEMGMGSELVSCMPGFIASIFDVICKSAKTHTTLPESQIKQMVLNTMSATGDLMLQNKLTFDEVVERVATKGGITEEGTKVIYEQFPATADELFEKTLEKRRQTTANIQKV